MESFQQQLEDILNDYSTQTMKNVDECCMDVSRDCAEKLHQTSPKKTGKYAKGWAVKEVKGGKLTTSTWVTHNKHYQLTHLLEKGHVKRGGNGRVPASPHIKPVEEWAQNELPKEIKNKLGG